MPIMQNFPKFPMIADIPVAATLATKSRKRRKHDHPDPVIPPFLPTLSKARNEAHASGRTFLHKEIQAM
jgi:hypothetical protein